MPNRLAQASSPYLLQHKDNPVDWRPWSDEAFEEAARRDVPVFLSVGYATCHWCHVMAHESFEDEEVARLMNEAFVAVKVDREERPDVDAAYMAACQMMTGRGGWPLTVLLTPDRRPFYAATYLPRESRYGQMGMLEFVPRIQKLWQTQREQVLGSAERMTETLRRATSEPLVSDDALDAETLAQAAQELARRYDRAQGGFGSAPKFPSPHQLSFLLRYAHRTGERRARQMAEHTLQQMALGGLFDHLGGGFHRYSTDARWHLPHFEKMLYDQAGLALAYAEGFALTGRSDFAETARRTLDYVLCDLAADREAPGEGGFFSAEDADSEGREGAFYVWTRDELDAVLGEGDAVRFADAYGFEEGGNFQDEATHQRTGENVLHLRAPLETLAREAGEDPGAYRQALADARKQLFEARENRPRPLLDDKVLTDWNGFLLVALSRAARYLGEARYAEAADRCAAFLWQTLRTDDGRLLHRYRDGDAAIPAFLDDHAFLLWGLTELYEVTHDPTHLRRARTLADALHDLFWDDEDGGFFLTARDGEQLIVRQKEVYDGAMPSGISAALIGMARLARLTGDAEIEGRAAELTRSVARAVRAQPSAFCGFLCGLDLAIGPAQEVVVAAEDGAAAASLLAVVGETFRPRTVHLLRSEGHAEALAEVAPFTREQHPIEGAPSAYVCEQHACRQPVTSAAALREALA